MNGLTVTTPVGPPPAPHVLPRWASVLAVVAHPDDESFGLGAVLDTLVSRGASVSVVSLTSGEASTVHGVSGDLSPLRALELRRAAEALGLKGARRYDFPDGQLDRIDRSRLAEQVKKAVGEAAAEALVVFDASGVTGHADHRAATLAALDAARALGLPVIGWTLPKEVADELLGDREHLRWLIPPRPQEPAVVVDWEEDDRFTIMVRGHRIVVDQPHDAGGGDVGPTPTDLLLASLASCVAFYSRRYLRRHHLDATGLTVSSRHTMARHPNRVGEVDLLIELPTELSPSRRAGLLAQARHCTVHNTLVDAPTVVITLDGAGSETA